MQKTVAEVHRLPVFMILVAATVGIGAEQMAPHADQQPRQFPEVIRPTTLFLVYQPR